MTSDPRDDAYFTAQYCLAGHLVTNYFEQYPEEVEDRCHRCGSATITACPKCQAKIRGDRLDHRGIATRPAYCIRCGEAFPWTAQALAAATELAETVDATPEERHAAGESIRELVTDGPAAKVAAVKFRSFLAKAGTTVGNMFREILVDVMSETAKKVIWPDAPPSRR